MTDPGGVRPSDGGSRWSELRPLLDRAFDLPAAQRLPFLRQACDGDSELYAEAVALLEADADGGVDPLADGVHAMAPQLVQEALPEPEEEAPRRLGPYRLLSQLGAGGMGTVYLAERADQQFRQQVAIKLLHAERAPANLNRRFLNERQILAGLRHPHIARFLDGGVAADGSPYMVMELVEGEPIDRFCDRRRLGIEARLELFEQACDAVRYAHQNLVVHRDLKPSHVRVTDSGVVKLLDFGIAKNLDPERADDDPAATRTHLRQLTPRFASPEQILGERMTTASDVYSLGVLLYHLLVGRSPYQADDEAAMQRSVLEELPDEPSVALFRAGVPQASEIAASRGLAVGRLRRRLRGDLDSIVTKALRKQPARRYASAEQLAEDLARFREGVPVRARRDTRGYRLRKWVVRQRAMMAALALAAMAAAAALVGLAGQRHDLAQLRDELERSHRTVQARNDFLESLLEPLAHPVVEGVIAISQPLESAARHLEGSGGSEPDRAELLETLSEVYRKQQDYEKARPLLEAATELRQQLFSAAEGPQAQREPAQLALARSEHDLGVVYFNLSQTRQAIRNYETSVAGLREVLEPAHPEIIAALTSLSLAVTVEGDHEKAEALRRQILTLSLERFGPDHPEVALAHRLLAATLRIRGKLVEAERAARAAVRIYRALPGDDAVELAVSLRVQSQVMLDLGRLEAAEVAIREALELLGDPASSQQRDARFHWARVRYERGALHEAQAELRETLVLEDAIPANGTRTIHGSMVRILEARIALALGEIARARTAILQALELQATKVPARHHSRHWAMHVEGLVALAAGDLERAEQQLNAAHDAFRQQQEPEGWKHRTSLAALAKLHDTLGQPDRAAAYRQELRAAEAILTQPRTEE